MCFSLRFTMWLHSAILGSVWTTQTFQSNPRNKGGASFASSALLPLHPAPCILHFLEATLSLLTVISSVEARLSTQDWVTHLEFCHLNECLSLKWSYPRHASVLWRAITRHGGSKSCLEDEGEELASAPFSGHFVEAGSRKDTPSPLLLHWWITLPLQ